MAKLDKAINKLNSTIEMAKINALDVEIIAKGRGWSFRSNSTWSQDKIGNILFTICNEPRECLLALVPGMVKDDDQAKIPMLLYPDGTGEIPIAFAQQDENGDWHRVDIVELCGLKE